MTKESNVGQQKKQPPRVNWRARAEKAEADLRKAMVSVRSMQKRIDTLNMEIVDLQGKKRTAFLEAFERVGGRSHL